MINHDSLYVILFSFPIYQILFYTVQLLSFKLKNPSKKYLGLLLLCMTVFLILNAVHALGYIDLFSDLYLIYLPVLLSIAPAFFLYFLSITSENHDVNRRQRLILFSPAVFMFIVNIFVFIVYDKSSRVTFLEQGIFQSGDAGDQFTVMLLLWMTGVLLVFFQIVFAIIRLLRIIQTESDLMRKQPSRLAYLEWTWVIGISISVMVFLIINAMFEMLWPVDLLGVVIVYNLLMLISGGLTGYLGMKQDTLLNQVVNIGQAATISPDLDDRQVDSGVDPRASDFIDQDEVTVTLSRLNEIMLNEKPYLKTDFSLQDLCSLLQVNRRKVSYVLNEVMGKNFYGIVNEYRVKEAQQLIMRDEVSQLKIEALGEMVGFQSKSSFNACFKKFTGLTPSEYKNKQRAENAGD
ncbi:MAG: helix-turn-helix domain-containing protein [Bacteroidales bacterium]|nr:helix-turn-helix domain-containing protein [Bacteroidales bacterium]